MSEVKQQEEKKDRHLQVPGHSQQTDPENFGKEGLSAASHLAMFNGIHPRSEPEGRSLDSGIRVRQPLRETSGTVEAELSRTTTSIGAQANALVTAPDAPEHIAMEPEAPIVAPPAPPLQHAKQPPAKGANK